MGRFLSMSGIPDSTPDAVEEELHKYLERRGGTLYSADSVAGDKCLWTIAWADPERVVVEYSAGLDFEGISAQLSRRLKKPIFGFHIHDSDFWMYAFYLAGQVKDRFCPVPEYYEGVDATELRGRPRTVAKHWPGLKERDIKNYLVNWRDPPSGKAYPDDEYEYGNDLQLSDFMKRLRLPFPRSGSPLNTKRLFGSLPPSRGPTFDPARIDPARTESPLLMPIALGDTEAVRRLLDEGADPNGTCRTVGQSVIVYAALNRRAEVIEILLAYGARIDTLGLGERTLLHLASSPDLLPFAEYLIEHGLSVNARDASGETPLHSAAAHGSSATIELLLSHGADINAESFDDKTPLDIAKKWKQMAVAELLKSRGGRSLSNER